ncbi:hypothetical protein EY04_17465 [Pseudomonas chlororaphis]|nr:hypothetical protein EY04_17465 [Pseudomonas chlororaphis]
MYVLGETFNRVKAERYALRAELDALKAQPQGEPVAYLCQAKGSKWLQYGSTVHDPWLPGEVDLTPLYASPPALVESPISELEILRSTCKQLEAFRDKVVSGWLTTRPACFAMKSMLERIQAKKGTTHAVYGFPEDGYDVPLYTSPPAPVAVVLPRDADKAFKEWASALPSPPSAFYAYLAGIAEVARLNSL